MIEIAISGASGFLGSYLLPALAEDSDYRFVALTRRLPMSGDTPGVRWMHGDLGSMVDCRRFVKSAELVVHLAHATTPLTSDLSLPADVQLNLIPTLNLVQAIREAGTRPHVIYASSGGAIYGPRSRHRPVRETSPCRPSSSYGIVKLAVEHYLRAAAAQGWLRSTALRIANPYGVLLPTERTQGFIGVALNRIVHRQPVRLFGNPNNVRDYIHLEDVARFVRKVLTVQSAFAVYNVGSGKGWSVLQVLDLLRDLTGREVGTELVQTSDAARSLASWIVLDITRAHKDVGWTPSIDFEQGLRVLCRKSLCTILK